MRGHFYGFPNWIRTHVSDPISPTKVQRWFAERGVSMSRQAWTKLLDDSIDAPRLETWAAICEATGEPLSTFITYVPTGRVRVLNRSARAPRKRKVTTRPKTAPTFRPPNPRDYIEVQHG